MDRYAYVNNSPLNYVDPTGHFTEDAIKDYLTNYCNGMAHQMDDCGTQLTAVWQADEDWWNMITTAQAGDNLFGTYTSGQVTNSFVGAFTSSGNTSLTGIISASLPSINLMDIQNSIHTEQEDNIYFGQITHKTTINWMGFFRPDKNGAPTYWNIRPGYEKTEEAPQYTGVAQGAKWTLTGAATVGCYFTPAGFVASAACGIGTALISDLIIDGLDVESNDYHVQAGPVYFNFQVAPDLYDTWTLEHTSYRP